MWPEDISIEQNSKVAAQAVLEESCICAINSWSLLQVEGNDAETFLQGQFTCDVSKIDESHSSLGAYCNIQGRMLAIFRIIKWQESYFIILPHDVTPTFLSTLNRYGVFSKVTITDVTNKYGVLGLSSPLNKSIDLPKELLENCYLCDVSAQTKRYLIVGSKPHLTRLWNHLEQDAKAVSSLSWSRLSIEARVPVIFSSTSELFTPHMVDLPKQGGVSFTKGCYLGQEIIARTEHRGKVKKHLHRFQIQHQQAPVAGTSIVTEDSEEAGTVLYSAITDEQCYEGLAVIDERFATTPLNINGHSLILAA